MGAIGVIVVGSPGSGKSSQCASIRQHFNLVYISVGDLVWKTVGELTEVGLAVKACVENGEPV